MTIVLAILNDSGTFHFNARWRWEGAHVVEQEEHSQLRGVSHVRQKTQRAGMGSD
jgi:hypothetical protein